MERDDRIDCKNNVKKTILNLESWGFVLIFGL